MRRLHGNLQEPLQFKGTLRLGPAPGGVLSKIPGVKESGFRLFIAGDSHPKTQWLEQQQFTTSHNSGDLLCGSSADFTCEAVIAGGFTGLEGPRWPHSRVRWLVLASAGYPDSLLLPG